MCSTDPSPATYRSGSGSPLVLLHPLFGSWRSWRPVLGALAAHHEVFAPTLAGHRTGVPLPPGPAPLSVFVDEVERELDTAGFGTVHVAGNSLGGRVAVELGRRGRARSVVAFSPGCARRGRSDGMRLLAGLGLLRAGMAVDGWLPGWTPGPLRRWLWWPLLEHGERLTSVVRAEAVADARGCRVLRQLVSARSGTAPLPVGSYPLRVAWGGCDRLTPWDRVAASLRTVLPGAELVVLPRVGHTPMWDDPDLVVATIRDVTAGVDG
ncbi:MAG TPA: alpha/beta hydrolase [Pseudonocardia sp.]|nr:alpha/beta hydrolase [Pseudonocardia sp.]